MKFLQRPTNCFSLVDYKISEVVLVRFGVQECSSILCWGFPKKLRNEDKLKEPIPSMEHVPIEEGSRRPAIAVHKRMVIREPKVKNNPTQDGMNKKICQKRACEFQKPFRR